MNRLFELMNPVVVPLTSVKFKSAFLHAKRAVNFFYENFSVYGEIENL